MKISTIIETLTQIKDRYGDIAVTGGHMHDDRPLSRICVTDQKGMEIWPEDPNGTLGSGGVDGVFFE